MGDCSSVRALGTFKPLIHRGRSVENRPNTVSCPAYLGGGAMICTCDGRAVPPTMTYCTALPWQGAVQLRASGNPSYCCCCWCFTKCTQNTDITDIKQGRQGPALYVQYEISLLVFTCELRSRITRIWHPPPSLDDSAKAGSYHLNKENTPLFPTGIGERYGQTIWK